MPYPDDARSEMELAEQVRRFPEQYPVSYGGLMPDDEYFSRQPRAASLEDERRDDDRNTPFDLYFGDLIRVLSSAEPEDQLGALADNDLEWDDDFEPFDPEF